MFVIRSDELDLYHGIAYDSVCEAAHKIGNPTTLCESSTARVDHELQHHLLG